MSLRSRDIEKYSMAVFVGAFLLVFLFNGINPYLSFISYISQGTPLDVSGGVPSQPVDHPIFNPGNITFSQVTVTLPNSYHFSSDWDCVQGHNDNWYCSDDKSDYRNAFYDDGQNIIVARVLTYPNGTKKLLDGQFFSYYSRRNNTNSNDGFWSNGCHEVTYVSQSSKEDYNVCLTEPAYLENITVPLNETGMYTLSVVTMPVHKQDAEQLSSDLSAPFYDIYLKQFRKTSENQQNTNYPYSCTCDICYGNVSQDGYDYTNLTGKTKECDHSDTDCFNIDVCSEYGLNELLGRKLHGYNWDRYDDNGREFIQFFSVYVKDNYTKDLLDNGSYDENYTFEVKPSSEILEEQLAQLRNDYDVQINQLMSQLDDENLTAEQFKVLMDQYEQLLENKTDARLVEKLILLRYDFEYKLKQYQESDSGNYTELKQQWDETVPLLQLDINALNEKYSSLQQNQLELKKEIQLLLAENDTVGAAKLNQTLQQELQNLTLTRLALNNIGWYKLGSGTKTGVIVSLGALLTLLFSKLKRRIIK